MPGFALQNSTQPLVPQALAAGASAAAVDFDVSGCDFAVLQVAGDSGGAIAATNGLQVQLYRRVGQAPNRDSSPLGIGATLVYAAINQTQRKSWELAPGRYSLLLTNKDATNALANVRADLDTYLRS